MSDSLTVTIQPNLPNTVDRSINRLIKRQEAFVNELTSFGRRNLRGTLNRAPKNIVSAPGEPPIRKSGNFNRSIEIHSAHGFGNITVGSVGPTIFYAPFLEYGTRRMAARPWANVTADNITRHVQEAAQTAFAS